MELFWQEAPVALPDQLAPLPGSAAFSGAAEAAARVGVDICSEDRLPPLPMPPTPCPCDPDELAELLSFLECPVPESGAGTQDEPPLLSTPYSQEE